MSFLAAGLCSLLAYDRLVSFGCIVNRLKLNNELLIIDERRYH